MNSVLEKVEQYMTDNHMLSYGERVVVGVSGGADSMCLLFVLMSLRKKWKLQLCAVHINHGIRGEAADHDQLFVENFCESNHIMWKSFRADIPSMAKQEHLSEEEAGRKFRYACFGQVLEDLQGPASGRIAVAHNKNDVAETLLFNLFRGSGIRGLGSIPPVRGNIIRPLLCLERREIEDFLAQNHIEFCTDKTNFENDYTRNRLRNELLPYVTENINANAAGNLWRMACTAADVSRYLQKQQESVWPQVCRGDGSLDAQVLRAQDPVIIHEIIRRKIAETAGQIRDIGQAHIEAAAALLEKSVGKQVNLPYGITVVREYDCLRFCVPGQTHTGQSGLLMCEDDGADEQLLLLPDMGVPKREYTIPIPGVQLELSLKFYEENQRIEQKIYTKWLDYDKIKNGLSLRRRRSGDYMIVDGKGSRKLLRRLMIDEKIPKAAREHILCIADGSHIVWMPGSRISSAYKVTPQTKKILEIKIKGEEYDGR